MRIQAIVLASSLLFGTFTTACAGDDEDTDEAQGPDQASELITKDSKVTPQTKSSAACAGSKVKTSCNQQAQMNDYIRN